MIERLHSAVTQLGRLDGALYLLNRGFARVGIPVTVSRLLYLAQPIPEGPLLGAREGSRIPVRRIPPDHPALVALPTPEATLRARAGNPGTVCFAAFDGDVLAGCAWLTIGRHDDEQFRVSYRPLPEGRTAWDYDFYVLPRYRLGFTFARLWDAVFTFLRDRDVGWTYSYVESGNQGSLRAHLRLGGQQIGKAVILRLGGWQFMLSSIPPRLHLSTGEGSRPVVSLTATDVARKSPAS
jgi:hypothetical protein